MRLTRMNEKQRLEDMITCGNYPGILKDVQNEIEYARSYSERFINMSHGSTSIDPDSLALLLFRLEQRLDALEVDMCELRYVLGDLRGTN